MLNQIEVIDGIVKAFHREGILNRIIIVGSWCIYFYGQAFPEACILKPIVTTDIDIDTSLLRKTKVKIDIPYQFQKQQFHRVDAP